MKVFRAVVLLADGRKVEVEYPTDATDPNRTAIQAAAKALGVPGFAEEPRVRHNRTEGDGQIAGPGLGPRQRVQIGECSVWARTRVIGDLIEVVPDHVAVADLNAAPGTVVTGTGLNLVVESVEASSLLCSERGEA